MRISERLSSMCVKSLIQSMDTQIMCMLAKQVIPGYDIHRQTGIPEGLAVSNRHVARQIVSDMIAGDHFPEFVALLIEMQDTGLMGRKYPVFFIDDVVRGMYELGFLYDRENRMFIDNPAFRYTRNWGALRNGIEYIVSFLRIDIVGNSELVRRHSAEIAQKTYENLRSIVYTASNKRNGRIWSWEGDGGLVAFFFSNKHLLAALSAMEIIHELYIYNLTQNILDKPLQVRIAVHSGPFDYTENEEELTRSDTVKRVMEIESNHTKPDTITISPVVKVMLDEFVVRKFKPTEAKAHSEFFYYRLGWENI
ncbi:MAG: adenylate/guanylate cyclase domain-containing protein [Spirochaetales bacterium]|nr:MAG: adenylate/guanylate cyclase domain-containing protein [Spirochaetales bacterium]